MGRSQREKGKRGEREFADLLQDHGFHARRDGRLDDDLDHDADGYHFEVKRRETLALPAWSRQAEQDAGDRVPVVAYRRNSEPWRCSLPADRLLRLLALERAVREGIVLADDRLDYVVTNVDRAYLDG
jgi:Holliday junction resolvase